MKKYLSLLKYEFKTILKSSMSVFMILYPLLMLFITGFILPAVLEKTTSANSNASMITLLIGFVLTLSMGGFLMGAMLGFSLIENKDENTLINIATTPVTVSGYTTFKIIYTSVLAFLANLLLVGGLKLIASNKYVIVYMGETIRLLDRISIGQVLIFSVVASLIVPMIALVIGAIAKNKVEGFAFMKSGGIIIMIPLLTLLNTFQDWKQYLLGIAPNFWAIKAILNLVLGTQNSSNMSFNMYMVVGGIYTLIVGFICFRFFVKKSNLK
jgi:fluoroquinolone transport system permease protein